MPRLLQEYAIEVIRSLGGSKDGGEQFGVHIEYKDLYGAIVFITAIYMAGEFAKRILQMPALVGEIFCGILLGPPLLEDFVPNPEAWVMFGEIGSVYISQWQCIQTDSCQSPNLFHIFL